MNDKEFKEKIHIEIHALRLIPNYKPSIFEQKLNRLIAEEFKDKCSECKEKFDRLKYQTMQEQKKGFLSEVFGG